MGYPKRAGPAAGVVLFALDALLSVPAWLGVAALAWPEATLIAVLVHPASYLLFLYALGLYRRDALLEMRRPLGRAVAAAMLGGLFASVALHGVAAWLLALPDGGLGSGLGFLLSVLVFTATAACARLALAALRRRGGFRRRLLVVGAGQRAFDLILLLRREGRMLGYDVAFLHDARSMGAVDPRLAGDPGCRVLQDGDWLAAARRFGADQIVVAPDDRRGLPMESLLACRIAGFPVQEYLQFLEREIRRVDIKRIELGWLLYADGFVFGPLDRGLKRALDVTMSTILLLLGSPILLAAALAVRLEDGGPALFRQERVTQGGRIFQILKLRTMRMDAERSGAVWASAGDPRITRFGAFLRRSRIDELPQLINVLKGDMSFVGPRPERPQFTRQLAAQLPLYEERHTVRTGLTGWAQVNYPYGASLDDARSKLSYDLYYVKNFSVLFDLLIILQTLRVVLFPAAAGAR